MNPNVSVIVAVYNRFDLLKNVVESILAQTCPVSEVILVDDGSIDGTSEVLPRFIVEKAGWRDRVHYIHQQNQGQSVANNTGIARAKGEWLAFNANDDLWLPQKLEWQFRALEKFKDKCGACFTDAWFMNNPYMKMTLFQLTGRQPSEPIAMVPDTIKYVTQLDALLNIHPVWMQTLLARADLVRCIGGLDPQLRYGEDDDFIFRLACETNFCFVSMPMVLIDRTPPSQRHMGEGKNWDNIDFRLRMNQYRFEKRLHMSERLSPEVQKFARKQLSAVHSGWANWYLHEQEYEKACEAVSAAARYQLTPSLAAKWALTRFVPKLARKAVLRREKKISRKHVGIA